MNDFYDFETSPEILEEQDSGVWLSIGDLMSGLLMFFALLFITVMVQLKQYQEALKNLPLIIQTAIEEKLGGSDVKVDPETGDVSIGDRILFDEGSAELKPAGKQFLQQFIPTYSQIIFSEKTFDEMITRVVIEGHTSSFGDEQDNLDLSLKRALSVSNYILSELNFETKAKFKYKILAAGRGEIDANQQTDNPTDRKVVFRFQLKRPDWNNLL
ncbi:OmpA/MotB family protein [Oxynema aestuarii]|jgi:outer membrane protein OmpA-like peptidoglycan-associated protein|uniref:OmpA family protein n=1 Tax=Oxynema aestuarii AP17 TaxID=2064643 RepID=A0A6H1TXL5_9CYAN|nr:OmpA family protein [Oxynema aestuarii]QIZ70513.1 OmpA family protein [Oxynema aestuarii AP17]RMH72590.1 MAG: OmpA family protein [Cyanobacteria bacterium J007]